ncbi:AMP-binding protein [Azospirillum thermophilum]|uniref:AMP-binding protein n=1 Tax=Azospirillum thermophilum TaxID=2202148 RepID=UPI0011B74359|nr:AMP-binding protein [Azospirillum thermophilum]
MSNWPSIVSLLRARAGAEPQRTAYSFLSLADARETCLSYGDLDLRARATAARLQREGVGTAPGGAPESTVLLVFPAGFDFLASFFGCLYGGAVAVPVRYPNPKRPLTHLKGVAADSGATLGLTTAELRPVVAEQLPGIRWLVPEEIDPAEAAGWTDPQAAAAHVAYLQYTSGSTAAPKGVVVGHGHIMANSADFSRQFGVGPDSRTLSWLPHYHDLGLVFGCLQPVFVGCAAFLMTPVAFAQRPLSWLEAITRHRITHTGAPNFAYQSCLDIPEAQRAGLDLSSLQVCINGAEPVRADTVEAFTASFAAQGFPAAAMCPGYGLAECTLVATACGPGKLPTIRTVRPDRMADGVFEPVAEGEPGRRLVASGGTDVEATILVVDPLSGEPCAPGRFGEIWIAGPSVAGGYWKRPDLSARKFAGRLAAHGGRPFLRTGDLGAIHHGEVYVLGRMDDLIIIRGANHSAEDLELTVEGCDPALQPGGGAAFTVELQGEARLVIAHEVRRSALRGLDPDRLVKAILRTVSENHDLEVSAVVLLKPRGLPKTHSGKKQRHACRRDLLAGALREVARWVTPKLKDALAPPQPPEPAAATPAAPSSTDSTERQSMTTAAAATADRRVPGKEGFTDKVKDLAGWLRSYGAERLNSRLMDERRSIPPYVVLDLGNRGVLGLQAPVEYGGLGLDNRELAVALQQLAAVDTTIGSFCAVNNALGLRPILRHATAEKKAELLPILAPGRQLASFAMTEADAGSHVRNLSALGRPDGQGGWTLWGTKLWSGSAGWAGVINTFVRTEEGVTGFVLRQGSPGLRVGPEALTMGLRAMVQSEVRLEGVRVGRGDLLGGLGDGMTPAIDTMEFGRFAVAAMSLGVIKRCLQLSARHGGRRVIATGRLLDNPATLMRISDLTAAAAAIEALVSTVADRLDRNLPIPPDLFCACKSAGPEYAWRAADHLMQQMAGRGYIETNIAPQIFRDARVLRIFEGPTEPMNMHIGSRLIHTPEELRRFVADELGEPVLAAEIQVAAARIWERCQQAGAKLGDPSAVKQWAYLQAGEVAVYGLLLAAVRFRGRLLAAAGTPDALLRRAEEWARVRFDRRLAKALSATAAETVLLDSRAVEELVAGYEETIGDVEQTLAGEELSLDPLMRRAAPPPFGPPAVPDAPAAPAAPAPAAAAAGAATAVADGRAQEIAGWLKDWLAGEFQRDAAAIGEDDRFSEFGMDSVTAMMLTGALEQWLGADLNPTLVWDHPTVGGLAAHLATLSGGSGRAPAGDAVRSELSLLAQIDEMSEEELASLVAQYSDAE